MAKKSSIDKSKFKVLIGYPPADTSKGIAQLGQNRQFQYFHNPTFLYPVVPATAATMLKVKGYDVIWKDAIAEGLTEQQFFEYLTKEKPDLFALESKAPTIKIYWNFINKSKKLFPNMKIILMGDHVSAFPEESLKNSNVDYVLVGGHYDFALLELCDAITNNEKIPKGFWYKEKNKIINGGRHQLTKSLDEAPFPDRDLTKCFEHYQKEYNIRGRPFAYTMTGRDCWWGKCTFCFHPDTKILTKIGFTKIKDIKLYDDVLTYNGRFVKNDFVFKRDYSGKLINIKASNLPEALKCTPNHKLFVVKKNKLEPEFIEVEKLEVGDYVTLPLVDSEFISISKDEIVVTINTNGLALQQKIKLNNVRLIGNKLLFPIKEITTEDYSGDVYNISVPEDHSYIANLITVSNCVWDSNLFPKGTFRSRTPKNAADEVEMLVNKYAVKEIFDDCGTITIGKWLTDFCNELITRGLNKKIDYSCNMRFGYRNLKDYNLMKKAGFRLLKFGLESANQKTLQMLDKDVDVSQIIDECKEIKKAGLIVHLTMMVGYPWETKQDALNTLKLAKYLMHKGYADVLQSTVIMPYPGTPMWHQAVENKWFLPGVDPYDYEKYDMTMPLLKTVDATSEEIMEICDSIYTKVFLHPNYIYQHLKKIKSMKDIKYTLRGIKAVFGHISDFARDPSKQFSH